MPRELEKVTQKAIRWLLTALPPGLWTSKIQLQISIVGVAPRGVARTLLGRSCTCPECFKHFINAPSAGAATFVARYTAQQSPIGASGARNSSPKSEFTTFRQIPGCSRLPALRAKRGLTKGRSHDPRTVPNPACCRLVQTPMVFHGPSDVRRAFCTQ